MMHIYDCATYFNAFNRCAHYKPTYTLHNRYLAAHAQVLSQSISSISSRARFSANEFGKKSYSLACMHALRTAYRCQNLCNSYLYSFDDRIAPLYAPYFIFPSSLFIVWCSLCGLSHDCYHLQLFCTHIAIVFAVFWSHYSIHLTASGAPLPIALLFTIYRWKYAI